ncbi:MAG: hypothetical protein H6R04_844 [Burkholderiaceae bacterium]|nr:hypothetical protein [Burkholderiaceae bacterium]
MAMQKLLSSCGRAPALGSALFLVLALTACASKNPLIDDAPATRAVAPASSTAAAVAAPGEAKPEPKAEQKAEPKAEPKAEAVTPAAPAAKIAPSADAKPAEVKQAASPASKPATVAPAAVSGAKPVSATATIPTLDKPAPSGLQRLASLFRPYRVDLQQGNFVSQEMLSQLRKGMTKEQVRFLLGSPLLNDMFHEWRWDYLFRLQKPDGRLTANRVTVFFKENRVIRFENSELPNEVDYITRIVNPDAKPKTAPAKPEVKPEAKPAAKPDASTDKQPETNKSIK